ncbi:MAG: 1-(5-phosphoribosyl)-5-[(5-phosphoribosylamino)methylideneamino]imidazole-4-carboxamide isomerase [Thermodesulfobacteriota bacterium]
MIIIPAIDLKDGKCVRLRQGRMDSSSIFNDDPAGQASHWENLGARRIHVVDLNGSIHGAPVNLAHVQAIVRAVQAPVQVGGGIRNADTIAAYLDAGVDTVILGTLAVKHPESVLEYLARFPGKIAVGIDARNGLVAVEGWTESSGVRAGDLAARFADAGPTCYIYTDIERDGMMQGPNLHATRQFARETSVPVILSGGISSYQDIAGASSLAPDGVVGIIIGRALYEGKVELQTALSMVAGKDAG